LLSAGYVFVAVAGAGAGAMALEMIVARALLPAYGDSYMVWAALIAVVLGLLALGYGLADRPKWRRPALVLVALLALAGLWAVGLAGPQAAIVLWTGSWAPATNWGVAVGSGVSILAICGPSLVALGACQPVAFALLTRAGLPAGLAAGRMSAAAALGSLAGALLPTFVLLPAHGIRASFRIVGASLLVLAGIGLLLAALASAAPGRSALRDRGRQADNEWGGSAHG